MACYSPLQGFKSRYRTKNGKVGITFKREDSIGVPMTVACGQCIGCRLAKSREWAIRCVHEASLYDDNCFVTLTYDPENLPGDGSLNKRHFQKFIRSLRKRTGRKIRYFHCGEYGEKFARPHYHAILFGFCPDDLELLRVTPRGDKLYVSDVVSKAWENKGFVTVADVTFESCAYVARYCTKKITGDRAEEHYFRVDDFTGECMPVDPEYATMSLKPGIGGGWYKQFASDIFPLDEVVHRGRAMKPPRFYDSLYEREDPTAYELLKVQRKRAQRARAADNTPERLAAKKAVKLAQVSKLIRSYES